MNQKRNKGFTIVELTLAMAFVSLLLIAITMTVMQLANIYAKGITLKEVNQLGVSISKDMQGSIGASSPLVLGEGSADYKEILAPDSTEVAGGRLCTGIATYVWNLGTYVDSPVNKYEGDDEAIRLVKIEDRGKQYCSDPDKSVVKSDAVEMLKDGERKVALHSFSIRESSHDSVLQQALYQVVIEVGTNDNSTLTTETTMEGVIESVDKSCKPPSEEGAFQDYCAVNKFEFTARAGNRGEL